MSHYVICHVALYQEVVDPVSCDGSVEGVVDGAVSDVGAIHTATQVEVHRVSAQSEGLAAVTYLRVLNPASTGKKYS